MQTVPSTLITANLPRPYPQQLHYYGTIALGFLTNPKRLVNYLKYKGSGRTKEINYLPIKMDVDPVSRCNFHCTMCQVSDWPKYQRARDMTVDEFKTFMDSQFGVIELKIQGLGEPLLARDNFFDMVRYARKKNIWVRTTTNASLLHLKDNYKKLIDTGINEVQISIDGATKETFEGIRRGSIFEKVVENCKLINAYCAEKGVERTRMWTVVQRDNQAELPAFVKLASEMKFKRMTFSLDIIGWSIDAWEDKNNEASARKTFSPELALELIELGKKYGIEVTFWYARSKFDFKESKDVCPWPFERAYVGSDARISPCCMIGNPDVYQIGTADNFEKQWHGETYQAFRESHLKGEIPKVCKGCYKSRKALNIISENNAQQAPPYEPAQDEGVQAQP